MKNLKYGAILSYISIFFSMMYGFFITPFILKVLGQSEYGVYKSIAAMTSSIGILEFGIGRTIQKYIAQFLAEDKKEECYNFSAMGLIQAIFLSVIVLIVGGIAFLSIDNIYAMSFNDKEILKAQQLFILLVLSLVIQILHNVIHGVITGYNRFIFANLIDIVSLLIRSFLIFVLLPIYKNAVLLVSISILVQIATLIMYCLYVRLKLKHTIKLYKWDNLLFKESFLYTVLLFAQSIIMQLNGNIDNIIIGAVVGTSAVAIYSFAIQIFVMYEQFATSVSSVALPMVTQKIYSGATTEDLEEIVVKFGRVQWMMLGGALFGFVCLGKEFFAVWLGNSFNDCWFLCLILMIPVTFPLIVNICLTILKARNLLKFRTISMACSAIFNALFTIIGTKYWGYWGAAIGTAMSTIIGSIISMNIYYWIKLKMNVLKLYLKILERITLCLIITSVVMIALNKFVYGSWTSFIVKTIIFVMIYGILLLVFGMNEYEKNVLFKRRNKA